MVLAANDLNRFQQMELDELNELFEVLGIEPDGTDFLTGEMPEEVQQRFEIRDIDGLNWALRKLAALKAQQDKNDALRDAELARIQAWHAKESRATQQSQEFFNRLIQEYASERRAADPKYKGEKTPYGKVGFRKQQPEWTYRDEQAAISFLEANEYDALVKVEKKITSKTDFKKAFDVKTNVFVKDGEVVDVAEVTESGIAGTKYALQVTEVNAASYTEQVIDKETGEVVDDVEFKRAAAVDRMTDKVVPGVDVYERQDAIDVKPEV